MDAARYLAERSPESILRPTKSGRLPAQIAAATPEGDGNRDAARDMTLFLISHAPSPNAVLQHRDKSGRSLLQDASVAQNLDLVKCLICDYKIDPNDRDSLGRGIIHHAAMMGHVRTLQMLADMHLERLEWDEPDEWDQWTPLMHASRHGHINVVRFLIEHGLTNVRKKDKQGRTAEEIAANWDHQDIRKVLSQNAN
ncbi:ankyrin repeat-containing domain protein [Dichotomocladium elegans]|nr:ankyrin repeat-containing domain protein [Dichotomocladium elegans]